MPTGAVIEPTNERHNVSEDVVVEAPKATLFIERKVSPKQYESLTVGLHFPVELPLPAATDSPASYAAACAVALTEGFAVLKVQVYDQLGIEYTDNNGVIAENIAAKIPGSTVAASTFKPVPTVSQASTAGAQSGDVPSCPDCSGAMYDNRVGKRNPKGPDYKCKSTACNKAVWIKK